MGEWVCVRSMSMGHGAVLEVYRGYLPCSQ